MNNATILRHDDRNLLRRRIHNQVLEENWGLRRLPYLKHRWTVPENLEHPCCLIATDYCNCHSLKMNRKYCHYCCVAWTRCCRSLVETHCYSAYDHTRLQEYHRQRRMTKNKKKRTENFKWWHMKTRRFQIYGNAKIIIIRPSRKKEEREKIDNWINCQLSPRWTLRDNTRWSGPLHRLLNVCWYGLDRARTVFFILTRPHTTYLFWWVKIALLERRSHTW